MIHMEALMGTGFIEYVSSHMQRIIEVAVHQAGCAIDWREYQLPKAVCDSAHQMLQTLSNIASLNNNRSGQEHNAVEDFLAGMLPVVPAVMPEMRDARTHQLSRWT